MFEYDPKLSQCLVVSAIGLFMLIISLFGISPLVDMMVFEAGSFDMTEWGQKEILEVIIYAEWYYWMIRILGVFFCVYPFVYLAKRSKYSDVDVEDELWG